MIGPGRDGSALAYAFAHARRTTTLASTHTTTHTDHHTRHGTQDAARATMVEAAKAELAEWEKQQEVQRESKVTNDPATSARTGQANDAGCCRRRVLPAAMQAV